MTYPSRIVLLLALHWIGMSHAMGPAAESAAPFALRNHIHLVTPAVVQPYLEAVAEHFTRRRSHPAPMIETDPARVAADRFCAGSGVEYPDLLALPRRISHGEYRRCEEHDVGDILELRLGREVLVLAVTRDVPVFSLGARQLYLALAAQVPRDGAFLPNAYRTWRELDPQLPDLEIRVAIPARGHAARDLLDDRVLQAGCRGIPEIRAIYAAAERLEKCLTLRTDGRVLELPPTELTEYLEQAPAGTLAVLPLSLYEAAGRRLAALSFEDLLPSRSGIQSGDYALCRPLYLYAKIEHVHNRDGYGVAAGLREFLQEVSGETATEPGGDLDRLGLALLAPEQRVRQRLNVLHLRPMTR